MNNVVLNEKIGKVNTQLRVVDNLYKTYLKLGYNPEIFEDNVILVNSPIEFIVIYIDNSEKLSLSKLHSYWLPLKDISEFTGIKNYIIIAKGGYEDECFNAEGYSVRLETLDYINRLIKKGTEIELLPHNHLAYKNLISMWKENKRVAITQATGTGKSFIIAKAIQNSKGKVLLLCPTNHILDQFRELFISYKIDISNIDFVTYSKLLTYSEADMKKKKYTIVVLDELHRAGAEMWGLFVNKILDYNKNAYVLGTTATPIRYLDNRKDMTVELFNGNIAHSLDLFEAMARGILPVPKYIEALYDISFDLTSLADKVAASNLSENKKDELLSDIKNFKISWSGVKTVSNIISKHFTKDIQKAIVFCKDVIHLKEVQPLVIEWFKNSGVYSNIHYFSCYSTSGENVDELNDFKNKVNYGDISLLFSVNKINEGIHVPDIGGVLFLRKTISENIFLQQMGRALASTHGTTPIILDLINNSEILGDVDFYSSISNAIYNFQNKKQKENLITDGPKLTDVDFTIVDETKDFIKFLESSLERISLSWDDYLAKAKDCKERTGWFPGPETPNEDSVLIKWVKHQRKKFANNSLEKNKIQKLVDIGFFFTFAKEKWFKNYNALLAYKENNKIDSFFRHQITDEDLSKWIVVQRRRKKLNQMDEEEYNLLLKVGVSFTTSSDLWDYYIKRLDDYYKTHGYKTPGYVEDYELNVFANAQNRRYLAGELPQDKIDLLNSINFVWKEPIDKFDIRVNQLIEYKKKYGNLKVQTRFADFNNLGNWVTTIRKRRKKGLLSEEKIKKLDSLGFIWNPLSESIEEHVQKHAQNIIDYLNEKNKGSSVLISKSLANSLNLIRTRYKENKLDELYIKKLEEAGFVWDTKFETWDKNLNQLKEYHSKFGTFTVSSKSDFKDAAKLRAWIYRQRYLFSKGNYDESRYNKLRAIGYDLNESIKN